MTDAELQKEILSRLQGSTITSVRPLGPRLLVKRADGQHQSKGGLWIPDTAQKPSMKGLVLAKGPGRMLEDGTVQALPVEVGDTILFTKHAGFWGRLDDHEEVLILQWEDVLAVVGKDVEVGTVK